MSDGTPDRPPSARTRRHAPSHWQHRGLRALLLAPLGALFWALAGMRRALYRHGLMAVMPSARPLIVVGNLAVGGSGKTPVVIWLAARLRAAGRRPGIVSRGYGGSVGGVAEVPADGEPSRFGDEPVLIARETGCPVVVGRDRPAAVDALIHAHPDCDVVISDDGLQHYAMGRNVEIAVVDEQVLGNRLPLPAGPLREPLSRLREVDLLIVHGPCSQALRKAAASTPAFAMWLAPAAMRRLDGGSVEALDAWRGRVVHALAGIGRPERFFEMLRAHGLEVLAHPFADHHQFSGDDLSFAPAAPILMTCKDAVKCRSFAPIDSWEVPVVADIDEGAFAMLLEILAHGQSPA